MKTPVKGTEISLSRVVLAPQYVLGAGVVLSPGFRDVFPRPFVLQFTIPDFVIHAAVLATRGAGNRSRSISERSEKRRLERGLWD